MRYCTECMEPRKENKCYKCDQGTINKNQLKELVENKLLGPTIRKEFLSIYKQEQISLQEMIIEDAGVVHAFVLNRKKDKILLYVKEFRISINGTSEILQKFWCNKEEIINSFSVPNTEKKPLTIRRDGRTFVRHEKYRLAYIETSFYESDDDEVKYVYFRAHPDSNIHDFEVSLMEATNEYLEIIETKEITEKEVSEKEKQGILVQDWTFVTK